MRQALSRSDVVILSGGLGPTQDDLTKEITASVFGSALKEDVHTRERIQAYFDARGTKEIAENNWKQAVVPEGALVLDNENGTAPGLILEKDGKTAGASAWAARRADSHVSEGRLSVSSQEAAGDYRVGDGEALRHRREPGRADDCRSD